MSTIKAIIRRGVFSRRIRLRVNLDRDLVRTPTCPKIRLQLRRIVPRSKIRAIP
jgi:hypothetical protein